MKTRLLRCHQGSEHLIAIEIWAWNILRKHEQMSGITQIKAYSRAPPFSDERFWDIVRSNSRSLVEESEETIGNK
jgi:hypothetical protein